MQRQNVFGPARWCPGEGPKGQITFNFNYKLKSISKIFIPNFVSVLTNERYKTNQTGFPFFYQGHAPGVGLGGAEGAQVVIFFKHGHVAYQIDGDDKQNRMQVKFSS